MVVDQKNTGLYRKFSIKRTDGRDKPGRDRENADYFVLDLTYDPFAKEALWTYIEACQMEYPLLADDLRERYFPYS
jgi:hypothetical protein